ncbi:hypothetical protein MJO29_012018 [Puccinia striiformis f. sp. tritici]|nr:hypothetical protein MJO29_012018 [Puccinia striiformis f. sp. tritici]
MMGSLLLQGAGDSSCHQNQNNPINKLSRTFDKNNQLEHSFELKSRRTPIRTNNELIEQQLAQEKQQQELNNTNWSTAFLRSLPIQSFLHPDQSSSTNPQWHSEFANHHPADLGDQKLNLPPPVTNSNTLLGPSPALSHLQRLTPHHHHPYHHIQPAHPITQGSSYQHPHSIKTAPALDWDSVFLQYDEHHQSSEMLAGSGQAEEVEQYHQDNSLYVPRSHSPITSSSPDALARTAATLLATVQNAQQQSQTLVENDQDASTTDKFNQSSFMEFMRQLRDGEVKVEGDKVVQQLAPVVRGEANSNSGHQSTIHSTGYLHEQNPNEFMSRAEYSQNGHSIGTPAHPAHLQPQQDQIHNDSSVSQLPAPDSEALKAYRDNLESRIHEMNALMEESDAELERTQYQAMMNAFQGDGGGISELDEILNAASEVGRPEGQTWTTTDTHVPGASESWTEEFDQTLPTIAAATAREVEDLDFDEMGMFGRPIHAREFELERLKRLQRAPSAQQQEWEKLQNDWENMANDLDELSLENVNSTTITPAMFLERLQSLQNQTGYIFQQANPQLFINQDLSAMRNTSKHHSSHQVWEDSTINNSSSSLESVLEKEREVLSDPESATAWYELGVKQQENEREELAIQALLQAIKIDPQLSDAILALAISYSNENRKTDAFNQIENWINVEISKVDKYREAQRISSTQTADDQHQIVDEEESTTTIKLKIKHGELTNKLIDLARLGGRKKDKASVDPDVQIALGVLFNSNDEFEKACDCFGAALAVRPLDPLLFNRLGATLANSGKPEEAIQYYNRAIELLPSYIRARYNLSISLINLGKYFESIKNLLDSLVIQHQGSSSSSVPLHPSGTDSLDQKQKSGVTSDVLWQTLEINCSLLKNHFLPDQDRLDLCFLHKDLDSLKQILHDFL